MRLGAALVIELHDWTQIRAFAARFRLPGFPASADR